MKLIQSCQVLLFSLLISNSIHVSNSLAMEPQIIGGEEVEASDPIASMTVGILAGTGVCSGSVWAEDLVITAAHCVRPGIKIIFGQRMHAPEVKTVEVSDTAVPPGYSKEKAGFNRNDIALLYFKGGLPSGYAPVELPPEGVTVKADDEVTIAGYGRIDPFKKGPGILKKANVLVLDPEISETEAKLDKSRGAGSCGGDSGGPAFLRVGQQYYLWAIDNRGDRGCKVASIYAKVQAHRDWLQAAAQELRMKTEMGRFLSPDTPRTQVETF